MKTSIELLWIVSYEVIYYWFYDKYIYLKKASSLNITADTEERA